MSLSCLRSGHRRLHALLLLRSRTPAASFGSRAASQTALYSSPVLPAAVSPSSSLTSRSYIRSFCSSPSTESKEDTKKCADADKMHSNKKVETENVADHEETVDEKTQVLRAALHHVPRLGWSEAAMVAGARDVGISPAILGVFGRKEAALVEFFMDECLQNLLNIIETQEDQLSKMILQERITKLVKDRLEMQAPYVSRWAQALSIQAHPANLPTSFKQRAILMDEIWHAVGDRSSDMDWYMKRGVLGAVYTATELYMLTDYSMEFRESWAFLERRVKDAFNCSKAANEVTQVAQAVGAGVGNTFKTFFRQ